MTQQRLLKRDISTTNILIASAGGMIGSGWLFSPFIAAQMAGSHALVSWVIAAIFMLFIALPLCELGAMLPIAGGLSNYPTYTHGREVGFLFAWTAWLSYVVMTPIEIQAILQYGSYFFPTLIVAESNTLQLSSVGYLVAFVVMLFVVLLNSFGVRRLAEYNKYASLIKFILPSVAVVAFLSYAPHWHHVAIHTINQTNWAAIFAALSTGGVAFAFTGFQNGLVLAGEVSHPQRNIPIAILGAVLIGFVLYFMLQLSFLVAIPDQYVQHGWQALHYPGDRGPLVGLAWLLGLEAVAVLLMIDAVFSPFGTTLVYTAATSRILYGMALNQHLPKWLLTLNRHHIPTRTLLINFLAGLLSFLPFPGWQKLVAFLSSTSILSYSIGPICLLAMRQLKPDLQRPFRVAWSVSLAHLAFYCCNLMLYWCGFEILWKLNIALAIGLMIGLWSHRQSLLSCNILLYWFVFYMLGLLTISYAGSFGGVGLLPFPIDMLCLLPFSVVILSASQILLQVFPYETVLDFN